MYSILASTGIFASTIHAQDFKDVEGDSLIGRKTLPIVAPKHARKTILVGLLAWSVALNAIWHLDIVSSMTFLALAATVGVRFLLYKTVPDDQYSFYLYNVRGSVLSPCPDRDD